jgi:hypothetical protein
MPRAFCAVLARLVPGCACCIHPCSPPSSAHDDDAPLHPETRTSSRPPNWVRRSPTAIAFGLARGRATMAVATSNR